MKRKAILLIIAGIILIFGVGSIIQKNFPVLKSPYLGQKPPGMTPELFAEGIISGKGHTHGSPAVSSDLNMIYWDEREYENSHHKIYYSRCVNNRWTKPQSVPFTEKWDGETPVLSPGGDRLFFNSRRPIPENPNSRKERIWYVEIKGNAEWSDPKPVSAAINREALHWQVTIDNEGNLYFGSERSGSLGSDDIFYSAYKNGEYLKTQNLGKPINSENHESTPFIEPDGRYLLFVRRLERKDCIFVSRKNEDGIWAAAVNLTERHPKFYGTCPRVSPDGKYIFINRYEDRRANVYWVDAKIIDQFGPENLK